MKDWKVKPPILEEELQACVAKSRTERKRGEKLQATEVFRPSVGRNLDRSAPIDSP